METKKLQEIYENEILGEKKEQFEKYRSLILEYNQKYNLTTILEEKDMYYKHFLDSAAGVELFKHNAKVAEIGSGAGFPSIVLKILRPDLSFDLFESVGKKCEFLRAVVDNFGFQNVNIYNLRAEDCAKDSKFREKYDSVLRGAKYKLTVKPVFRTKAATVTFESEDASAIAFSGNKAGSTGFKVGETLNCTMIDRVTFTATCPNLQEIKVASVAHLVDTNKRTNQTFKPSSDSEKMSLTKTMDVNYEKEYLKVYFNTPTFEVSYTKDEESASNSNAGAVSIYDYTDLNKMLAVGSVGNPILLSNSDDKLSLLNSTYLL